MAKLRLKIEDANAPVSTSTASFSKVVKETLALLRELDCAVSPNRKRTLDWVVSDTRDMRKGSAYVEIESRVIQGGDDFSPQVAQSLISGLFHISSKETTPPLFSNGSVRRTSRILNNLTDTQSLVISSAAAAEHSVALTAAAKPIIQKLLSAQYKEFGAIEGRLEVISLRPRYFYISDAIGRRRIKCNLPAELEERAAENIGKAVEVDGLIAFNAKHEPIGVETAHLRPLHTDSLPSIQDILGMAPDFTDDLSTEDFIRAIRTN